MPTRSFIALAQLIYVFDFFRWTFDVKFRTFQIKALLQCIAKRLETKSEGVILAMSINPETPAEIVLN